jgi:N-acetylglucosaminyldiphosphoundecaprenol N-acetyl-beta-D-mannosaminyltransferase
VNERPLLPDRRHHIAGIPIDAVTMDETVAAALAAIDDGRFAQHGALNAAKVVRLQSDATLRDAVGGCELITADGQAVVWAGRVLGLPLPERVTGIDLMERLLAAADRRGLRVYLFGARPDVVADVAALVAERYPGVELVGSRNGYFEPAEEPAIVREIAATRPQLLFVAIESPKKELFLAGNRDAFGACFAVGVGGTFDVLAGRKTRAPELAQRLGLEWLFRLLQEPRRLAARYVVGNSRFIALVARERLGRRGRRRP